MPVNDISTCHDTDDGYTSSVRYLNVCLFSLDSSNICFLAEISSNVNIRNGPVSRSDESIKFVSHSVSVQYTIYCDSMVYVTSESEFIDSFVINENWLSEFYPQMNFYFSLHNRF